MVEDERTLSSQAQTTLIELNEKRADCQSRIGQLNLSGVTDCQACGGRCCDSPSDEYFSPVDYWLRKYVDGHQCTYSPRAIRKPACYAMQRLKHIARETRNIAAQIFRRRPNKRFPIAAVRYLRAAKQRPGCQFLDQNGCTLPYSDRPIRCVIYACPRMKRGLTPPVRSQYAREIGELYRISIATFHILRNEADRPNRWSSALLRLMP